MNESTILVALRLKIMVMVENYFDDGFKVELMMAQNNFNYMVGL